MNLNEKKLKSLLFSLILLLIMFGASCSTSSLDSLESKDWTVTANSKTKTFYIEHSELGPVLKDIKPVVEKNSEMIFPSNWKNDIMYTSLGLVSAENIHCLFDRSTDTMIHFSDGSLLKRNDQYNRYMDVTIPINKSSSIQLTQDYYTNVLGLKFYQPKPDRFETAPIAWSSWYCYYMGTTEEDLVNETDTLAQYLKPYGLEYVQLDACYTRGEDANYLEWNKQAFPKGGKWIFDYISDEIGLYRS